MEAGLARLRQRRRSGRHQRRWNTLRARAAQHGRQDRSATTNSRFSPATLTAPAPSACDHKGRLIGVERTCSDPGGHPDQCHEPAQLIVLWPKREVLAKRLQRARPSRAWAKWSAIQRAASISRTTTPARTSSTPREKSAWSQTTPSTPTAWGSAATKRRSTSPTTRPSWPSIFCPTAPPPIRTTSPSSKPAARATAWPSTPRAVFTSPQETPASR